MEAAFFKKNLRRYYGIYVSLWKVLSIFWRNQVSIEAICYNNFCHFLQKTNLTILFFRDRRFRRKFLSAIPICFLLLFMHFFNLIYLCKNLTYGSVDIASVGFVKIFSNLTFVVTSAKCNEMRKEVLYLISLKVIISGVSYMW